MSELSTLTGQAFSDHLEAVVEAYCAAFPVQPAELQVLAEQMARGDMLDDRRTLPGHVTTSAFIVNAAFDAVLLIHHRKLGRWFQPGGHWEPAESFWRSAEREALEETGIGQVVLHPWHKGGDRPIDIDTHAIPAHPAKGEAAHFHHDIRFVFVADRFERLNGDAAEVSDVRWWPINELAEIAPRAYARLGLMR